MAEKEKKKKKPLTVEDFDLKVWVVNVCRRSYKKAPHFTAALKAAKEDYVEYSKHGKPMRRVHYRCAECKRCFKEPKVAVDHIVPVVPVTGWDSFDCFVERLFLGAVQVLCNYTDKEKDDYGGDLSCHSKKTKAENALRPKKPKKPKKGKYVT